MSSPNVNGEKENVGIGHVEEVFINQVFFNKMIEILQSVTKRRGSRGEDEALECFLNFQSPIFVGETE
jgi:hypothetical protein